MHLTKKQPELKSLSCRCCIPYSELQHCPSRLNACRRPHRGFVPIPSEELHVKKTMFLTYPKAQRASYEYPDVDSVWQRLPRQAPSRIFVTMRTAQVPLGYLQGSLPFQLRKVNAPDCRSTPCLMHRYVRPLPDVKSDTEPDKKI